MKAKLLMLLIGMAGFGLAWVCWHLYLDHVAFHAVLTWAQQAAQAAAKATP